MRSGDGLRGDPSGRRPGPGTNRDHCYRAAHRGPTELVEPAHVLSSSQQPATGHYPGGRACPELDDPGTDSHNSDRDATHNDEAGSDGNDLASPDTNDDR